MERLRIAFEELRYRGLVNSIGEFCQAIEYKSPNQMSHVFAGRSPISKGLLLSLKDAFMVSPKFIMGESDSVFVEGYKPPKGLGEGALLKKIILCAGKTVEEVADKMGMVKTALYYHTHNETVPDHIKVGVAKALKKKAKNLWIE